MKNKAKKFIFHGPDIFDYDMIWKIILDRHPDRKSVAAGAFPAWDNTPRRGNNSRLFYKASPKKFEYYFKKRVETAIKHYDVDYIFINAWNEWGEGAHLEPDEYNRFGYLEAIKKATEKYDIKQTKIDQQET